MLLVAEIPGIGWPAMGTDLPCAKAKPQDNIKKSDACDFQTLHPRAQQLRLHFGRCEQFAHACGGFGLVGPELSLPRVLSPRQG